MGGYWEFPGGKVKNNEPVLAALKRELYEELNLKVESAHPFMQIEHDYPDKKIKLDVWVVDKWQGRVYGKEGQELEWTWINRLRGKAFPAANSAIIKAVALSPLYLITPDLESHDKTFINKAEALIESGIKLFQFRSKKTPFSGHEKIVKQLIDICNKNGCLFIYNGKPEQASKLGAHGVHLNSKELLLSDRKPLNEQYWVAASCHNMEEINHAVTIGVDFCVLSPIHETTSHSNGQPLGWKKFGEIARGSNIPIYALGGVQPSELNMAIKNGAWGIAMVSGIWNAREPVKAVRACLKMD